MARHPQPNNIKALKGEARPERFQPDGVETEKLMELPDPQNGGQSKRFNSTKRKAHR